MARCAICNGRGGSRVAGRWIKCECQRMTPAKRRAQRELHGAGARSEERELQELVHACDVLTAALNGIRKNPQTRGKLARLVRWALPHVIEQRNDLSDRLKMLRNRRPK